jgi:hypothetical protein
MIHNSFTTTLISFSATQTVSVVPSMPTVSQTVTPSKIDTETRHLSTESIISIISVVATIIIGIATLIVTVLGIAVAWWQWKKSRGRPRRASFGTNGMHQGYSMNPKGKLTKSLASRFQVSRPSNVRSSSNAVRNDFQLDARTYQRRTISTSRAVLPNAV